MTPSARTKNRAFLGLFPPFISWCALWILGGAKPREFDGFVDDLVRREG
jgi:hypothetical protein